MYDPELPYWTRLLIILVVLLVCLRLTGYGQALRPLAAPRSASRVAQGRNATLIVLWLTQRLDVREATGHNDGPGVAAIVRAGGGDPRDRPEWCGYTRAAAQRSVGLPIPLAGMQGAARAWFVPSPRLLYRAGSVGSLDSLRVGLCGGVWHRENIHHIVTIAELGRPLRKGRAPRTVWCLAGNEGVGLNAGLHRSLYPATAMFALANWLY